MKKFEMTAALLFLTFAFAANAHAQSKDEAVFRALVQQMANAQVAYDASTLERLYTSDFIEVSPLGEVDPRQRVLVFYKPEAKPPGIFTSKVDVGELLIRNYGKFAILIAELTFTIIRDGKRSPPRRLAATLVCRREKNDWKIASAQYTGIRPPEPPAPPKT